MTPRTELLLFVATALPIFDTSAFSSLFFLRLIQSQIVHSATPCR